MLLNLENQIINIISIYIMLKNFKHVKINKISLYTYNPYFMNCIYIIGTYSSIVLVAQKKYTMS